MTRRRKLAFALVATLAVFLLVEAGLRVAGVKPAYEADMVGWRLPANWDRHVMRGMNDPHQFSVSTNADGLRTGLVRDKAGPAFRVAVMGDSTVFGWGVDNGHTLPDRMEPALAPRCPGRLEVLNAAQPGYSSAQLFWLWEEVVVHYRPDVVLFFPPQHDHSPAAVSDMDVVRPSGPGLLRLGLARHSRLYHLLWQSIRDRRTEDSGWVEEPGLVSVPRVSDAQREELLDAMASKLAEWDGTLVLGAMPFYMDLTLGPDDPDGLGVAWLYDYSERSGAPLVDVRRCCGPDADALVFPFDQGHLNQQGNKVVGEATGRELARVLWP